MHRLLQLICYACALLCVLIVGNVLGVLCWQGEAYWDMALGERPLPLATLFVKDHFRICPYLMLFPWLAFVGVPLVFPSFERSYWDTQMFFLRLTTFILAEAAIVLFVLLSILAPAAGMLMALPNSSVGPLDPCVQWYFWLCGAIVLGFAVMRIWQWKSSPKAQAPPRNSLARSMKLKRLVFLALSFGFAPVAFIAWCRWDSSQNHGYDFGYYGEFNQVRQALIGIPGVTITRDWANTDFTLEEFGFDITTSGGQTIHLDFQENDPTRRMSGRRLTHALTTRIQTNSSVPNAQQ